MHQPYQNLLVRPITSRTDEQTDLMASAPGLAVNPTRSLPPTATAAAILAPPAPAPPPTAIAAIPAVTTTTTTTTTTTGTRLVGISPAGFQQHPLRNSATPTNRQSVVSPALQHQRTSGGNPKQEEGKLIARRRHPTERRRHPKARRRQPTERRRQPTARRRQPKARRMQKHKARKRQKHKARRRQKHKARRRLWACARTHACIPPHLLEEVESREGVTKRDVEAVTRLGRPAPCM